MMKSRILTAALAATAATTSLAACGSGSDSGDSDDAAYAIGFVNADSLDFHQCLEAGIDDQAQTVPVEVVHANSARDPAKEQANVEDMIVRQVDAIVLQTVNIDSLEGAIAKAVAADIPIFLTSVGGPDMAGVAGAELSDVQHTGEVSAEWLNEDSAGQDVDVAIIAGAPGAASDLFVGGFKSALGPHATVVFEQPGMFQRAKAQEVAENLLQSNPDVDYVFVPNEEMGFGALTAFENAGRSDIKIITNGGTEDGLEATSEGRFAMLVASSPYELGVKAVSTMVDLLENPTDEPVIGQIPTTVVTKDNVDDAPSYCG
ncbi:sugar ABC transporter substrate-binding protein [Nocardioides carbamazepini]|uniref:sugar ABC transporter substrate-binding protein n=1 Tax=Nocardioides carbamazepini TaxID=2854259 RepID=UPI00214A6A74|nr:sugar ABC transporter substrate-binding protein [Nocardioides carbamazepini]MCR1782704.1 sugar ABC transporter substrate-binding protein [Nocardioides carbamazepini]